MAMNTRQTVVGVFDEPTMADRAVEELQNAGFNANQIHFSRHSSTDSGAGEGFFAGVKRFFAGDDAVTDGINSNVNTGVDDFSSMGYSNDEADWYNSQYNAGRTVVSVRAGDRENDAMQILRSNGAYNYDMRASNMKTGPDYAKTSGTEYAGSENVGQPATYSQSSDYAQTGNAYNTYQQPTDYAQTSNTYQQPTDYAQTGADVDTDTNRSMRLREEQLQADKERVQAGEVRLHKDVVEEQRTLNVPVTHEEVYVERRDVPAGQMDAGTIGEGEVVRVPVSEEQVNVSKNTVVTGEVGIGKRAVTENQQVTDTVRREEAHLGRSGDVNVSGSGADLVDRTTDTTDTTDSRNSL